MERLAKCQIDPQLIEQLRARAYEYSYEHRDEINIEDVRSRIAEHAENVDQSVAIPDLLLKRFLLYARPQFDLDAAMDKFVAFFKLRAPFGLSKLTMENATFQEFWRSKIFIDDESVDRDGNKVVIVQMRLYRKLPQTNFLIKRGMLFITEQYDLALERGEISGLTVILDLEGYNYFRDLNLSVIFFTVELGLQYLGLCHKVLVYNLPWALVWIYQKALSMIQSMLGLSEVPMYLVNRESIDEHVAEDQRPHSLNGSLLLKDTVPRECVPYFEWIQLITERHNIVLEHKNVLKFYSHIQQMWTSM